MNFLPFWPLNGRITDNCLLRAWLFLLFGALLFTLRTGLDLGVVDLYLLGSLAVDLVKKFACFGFTPINFP